MAKRKSPSNKAAKKSPKEDIIIDGVAEEIDPAQVKPKEPKSKAASASNAKDAKPSSGLGVILSLIALFFGVAGAALGALAYISIVNNNDHADYSEIAEKIVANQLSMALTPLYERITIMEASIDALTNKQSDGFFENDLSAVQKDIIDIKAALTALEESASSSTTSTTDTDPAHTHDRYATIASIDTQIKEIRDDIAQLQSARRNNPAEGIKTEPATPDNDGWWDNLLGAFSITRIDPAEEEAE